MLRAALPVLEMILGVVLLYSGITHLQNPYAFLDAVGGYRIVPIQLLVPTTIFLLAAHLTVGVALVCRLLQPGVYLVSTFLFGLFVVAQLFASARGLEVSCGCFGGSSETIGPLTIIRTVAMLLVSVLALLFSVEPLDASGAGKSNCEGDSCHANTA